MKKLLAVTAVIIGLLASPASAEAALVDSRAASSGPYQVTATCAAVIGAVTGFNEITYAVEAQADAHDRRWLQFSTTTRDDAGLTGTVNGILGVATSVSCEVVDRSTGTVYGHVAGGLPGPAAVAVGEVKVPTSATVYARVCGSAVFLDGSYVSTC